MVAFAAAAVFCCSCLPNCLILRLTLAVQQMKAVDGSGAPVANGDLMKRQAEWLEQTGDMKGAAQMYWASKAYIKAITILGDNGKDK